MGTCCSSTAAGSAQTGIVRFYAPARGGGVFGTREPSLAAAASRGAAPRLRGGVTANATAGDGGSSLVAASTAARCGDNIVLGRRCDETFGAGARHRRPVAALFMR